MAMGSSNHHNSNSAMHLMGTPHYHLSQDLDLKRVLGRTWMELERSRAFAMAQQDQLRDLINLVRTAQRERDEARQECLNLLLLLQHCPSPNPPPHQNILCNNNNHNNNSINMNPVVVESTLMQKGCSQVVELSSSPESSLSNVYGGQYNNISSPPPAFDNDMSFHQGISSPPPAFDNDMSFLPSLVALQDLEMLEEEQEKNNYSSIPIPPISTPWPEPEHEPSLFFDNWGNNDDPSAIDETSIWHCRPKMDSDPTISASASSSSSSSTLVMPKSLGKAQVLHQEEGVGLNCLNYLPEPPEADPHVMLQSLPERGKLLQAVIQAGPLLQTLLLAGPLPQWNRPPPPINCQDIPPASSSWSGK